VELTEAERAYENHLEALSETDAAYAAARSLSTVSSRDVQERLAQDEALVEYVVSSDGVSIFVVRPAASRRRPWRSGPSTCGRRSSSSTT